MNKKQIYFKSDFTVILASEAQWGGCPFRLSFYTASPSRAFVASFDGENWENCRLLDDGRLEVAINQKDGTMQTLMGIGTLVCAPEFYLDNDAFRDHVCNEFVKPFAPVFVDTDGTEYNVILDLNGSSTLVTIGTLPAFYMRGPMGDVDWEKVTPEQLEILQRPAREAADVANAAAAEATSAAENATSAADSANKQATLAATMISRAAKASAAAENAATDATKAADRAHEEADNALAASIDAKSATNATKSAINEANSVVTDSRNAMATIGAQFLNIKQNASEATQAANTAAEGATAAMENIEAPKDGKAYNRKDGAWTVAEGGMTPEEREKLTQLDQKVGNLAIPDYVKKSDGFLAANPLGVLPFPLKRAWSMDSNPNFPKLNLVPNARIYLKFEYPDGKSEIVSRILISIYKGGEMLVTNPNLHDQSLEDTGDNFSLTINAQNGTYINPYHDYMKKLVDGDDFIATYINRDGDKAKKIYILDNFDAGYLEDSGVMQKIGELEELVKSSDLDVISSMLDELNGTTDINGQLDEPNS